MHVYTCVQVNIEGQGEMVAVFLCHPPILFIFLRQSLTEPEAQCFH